MSEMSLKFDISHIVNSVQVEDLPIPSVEVTTENMGGFKVVVDNEEIDRDDIEFIGLGETSGCSGCGDS